MKVYRIEEMIDDHNSGLIDITSIDSNVKTLIKDINHDGLLEHKDFKINFTDKNGKVQSIVDPTSITMVNYINNKFTPPNNGDDDDDDCDNGCNCNGECYCHPHYPKDIIFDQDIITHGYINNDGVIYPSILADGTYVYECYDGTIFEYEDTKTSGSRMTSDYLKYFGKGYVRLEDGYLRMKIFIPEMNNYNMTVYMGSNNLTSKTSSIFINNIERSLTTNGNNKNVWQDITPKQYSMYTQNQINNNIINADHNDYIEEILLKSGQPRNTKNVDFNILVLRKAIINHVPIYNHFIDPIKINGNITGYELSSSLKTVNDDNTSEIVDNTYNNLLSNKLVKINKGNIEFKINLENDIEKYVYITGYNPSDKYNRNAKVNINGLSYTYKYNSQGISHDRLSIYNEQTNVYEYANKIKLNKGINTFIITSNNDDDYLFDSMFFSETVLEREFNNYHYLELPNIDNIYLFNNIDDINSIQNEGIRNYSVNITDTYNYSEKYGFDFSIKPYNLPEVITEDDKIHTTIEYIDNDNAIEVDYNDYMIPKLVVIGKNNINDIGRFIELSFYKYNYKSLTVYDDNDVITTDIRENKIELLETLPKNKIIDLGEDWKNKLYQEAQLRIIDVINIYKS
ncbi:hypothetical protein FPHOBKDP_00093 [Listeria phage LPJP1]|nr:hypothetical protein FPHOBKDP_00093 [Listeria phage LPJP1]